MNKKTKIILNTLLILVFLIVGNEVFALNSRNYKGIHQIDSEKNKNINVGESESNEDIIPISRFESPRVKKTVFGFHPYWTPDSYLNYDYELLTDIAYHSLDIDGEGNITDRHGWPHVKLINKAHSNGVRVVLVVKNFDLDEISTLLNSESNRQNAINNMLAEVQDANADGVNIDFEYVRTDEQEEFNEFMLDIKNIFHTQIPGSKVTVNIPAIDWWGGIDTDFLAQNTDGIKIMTYDYHWSTGPQAGPVSPFSNSSTWGNYNITNSINTYLEETNYNKSKLFLGVPYYGYDWEVDGNTIPANTLDTATAKTYAQIMSEQDTYTRIWDEDSLTPYYKYGTWHQVWYEDPTSISYKYNLVNTKDLGGVGIWALGYDGTRTDMWDKIDEYFGEVGQVSTEPSQYSSIITAAGQGGGPHIRSFDTSGEVEDNPDKLYAYDEKFSGGVRVALGDVDSDGEDEIITAPRRGGGPQVRIFERDGTPRGIDIWPFDLDFRGGVDVASGDTDGDGKDEIAVVQASEGQALVKVYRYNFERKIVGEWNAFGDFEGGGSIAMGDIDADGMAEVIVGAGEGGGPQIRVYEANGTLKPIQFFAFHEDFRGGIDVAAGDVDGDGKDEIGVCQMKEQSWCKVYRYNTEQTIIGEWKAFADFPVGGLIDMGHIDNDGQAEIVVGAGNAGGPQVRAFKAESNAIRETNFFAYDVNFRGGVDVAVGILGE